jgi:putative membrane protein
MIRTIVYFLVNICCFFVLDKLAIGLKIDDWVNIAWFLLILSVINIFVMPVIKFFTWPINFITFGLLGLLINTLALSFAVGIAGFRISYVGFRSIASTITNMVSKK